MQGWPGQPSGLRGAQAWDVGLVDGRSGPQPLAGCQLAVSVPGQASPRAHKLPQQSCVRTASTKNAPSIDVDCFSPHGTVPNMRAKRMTLKLTRRIVRFLNFASLRKAMAADAAEDESLPAQ